MSLAYLLFGLRAGTRAGVGAGIGGTGIGGVGVGIAADAGQGAGQGLGGSGGPLRAHAAAEGLAVDEVHDLAARQALVLEQPLRHDLQLAPVRRQHLLASDNKAVAKAIENVQNKMSGQLCPNLRIVFFLFIYFH